MSFMVQALVLLVSGVYYQVEVLPALAAGVLARLAGDVHPRWHPRRASSMATAYRTSGGHSWRSWCSASVLIPLRDRRLHGRGALGEEDREAEAAGVNALAARDVACSAALMFDVEDEAPLARAAPPSFTAGRYCQSRCPCPSPPILRWCRSRGRRQARRCQAAERSGR